MKSIKINIANPKDPSLDKVRIYVAGVNTANGLFTTPHKVYEGVLKNFHIAPRAVNKAKNYIGIEYFNDAGRVFRGIQPRPVTVIDDMGPWEFVNKKFINGDTEIGSLVNVGSAFPLPATVLHKHIYEVYGKLIAAVTANDLFTPPEFNTTPQLEMFTMTVGGEIYAMHVIANTNNTITQNARLMNLRLEAMPAADKQVNIGGFIWELVPIYLEFLDCLLPTIAHSSRSSSSYSMNSKRIAVISKLPGAGMTVYGNDSTSVACFMSRKEMLENKQLQRSNTFKVDPATNDIVYTFSQITNTFGSPLQYMLKYVGRAP